MSSAPSGWQNPKTNWNSADVPLPTDFNRIEGNIQAIELGSRTVDQSLAPSGNVGNLRQILSWFANRIKAILGTTNWYDAPPYTLAGATPSATANRLVARDANGRAKFAQGANAGDAVVYPVPVTSLKQGQGSVNIYIDYYKSIEKYHFSPNSWTVHRYAFAAPLVVDGRVWRLDSTDNASIAGLNMRRRTEGTQIVTWDYLTASGHPRVWAEVDDQGEIYAMWEAEDPADPEFPDELPFKPSDGRRVIPVEPPDQAVLSAVSERLQRAAMPRSYAGSIYAADPPPRAVWAMFAHQLAERALEEPSDIRDVLSLSDRDRRYWYLQLWLRQASRILHDHRFHTLIPLYQEMCRVNLKTGKLELR